MSSIIFKNSIRKRSYKLIKKGICKIRNTAKFPDFIIIGAQKGGTSSLLYYLRQHPYLVLPKIKEIHYYD